MTPLQYWILAFIALLGIGMVAATCWLGAAYVRFQRERKAQASLLKRLENNAMLNKPNPPRKKYFVFWSH